MARSIPDILEKPTATDALDLVDTVKTMSVQIARLDAALVAAGAHPQLKNAAELADRLVESAPEFAAELATALAARIELSKG